MMTVRLLQAFPEVARDLPPSVPTRAGRRVPGHQPRAVRADPRAVRRGHRTSYGGRRPGRRRGRRDDRQHVDTGGDEYAAEPAELMVVGDADQSIYAFRGANIRNILAFEEDFPNAETIMLEQNYRSTQTILSAANAVIAQNKGRKPKNLWSDAGDGEQIVGYVADNEHDEAQFVAEEIDRLTDDEGGQPRRRRRLLPHQRAEPGLRGSVHPGRAALQGRRRRAVLRAPRGARRAGLPPDAGQPRRHRVAAADPQHPEARHRRTGRGVRRGARRSAPGRRTGRPCARPRTLRPSRPGR